MIPIINASVAATAKAVWEESIDKFGSMVTFINQDGSVQLPIKAFYKRPKILGLWDRTQASYDQERYMLMIKASDLPAGVTPEKFMRARWDDEDHVFISTTKVELGDVIFGYRIMVKG